MGRGRMELIHEEKARKITFQKRKNSLMKKAYEFSTLCGVDVCLIIYASDLLGQGPELETWPQETREAHRIIQKYNNTTSDRRPKIYDMQEYYKDRIKKAEAEIAKVRKEKFKIMYTTWDDSSNAMGEEQLSMFATMLDYKLDACNQRINMLKRDLKGKAIAEPPKAETAVTPYLASNPSSHLNFLPNMYQGQLFPPPVKPISDNNQLAFDPFPFGQSSQACTLHFGQSCLQLMGKSGMVDWADQVGAVTCDPKTSMLHEGGVENIQNSSLCYYNGNMQKTQPYAIGLETLSYQKPQI